MNIKKLQIAIDRLQRKADYINMEYYYPKFEAVLKKLDKKTINKLNF